MIHRLSGGSNTKQAPGKKELKPGCDCALPFPNVPIPPYSV